MNRILSESRDSVTCAICTDIFEDPRTLRCSHSFCFHCLIAFRGDGIEDGDKFCPICRENTVPPINRLQHLPKNEFANQVVALIKEQDKPVEASAPPADDEEGIQNTDGEFYTGPLLKDDKEDGNGVSVRAVTILGGIVGFLLGGPGGAVAGAALGGLGSTAINSTKYSYDCNGCGKKQFSLVRYKCGECPDFNICSNCFGSDLLSQLHNVNHPFLKLKFKQQRQLPPNTPLLVPEAADMVKTMNYKSHTHGRAFVHSPERLITLPGIQCKSCTIMPIKGIRYKCGMCPDYDLCANCEAYSEEIHNKRHVFIALKHHLDINIMSKPLLRAHFY